MTELQSNQQPTVSVVIPCYNRAGLIPRAVESVQGQNYPNMEIILVDDGSSDDTASVVEQLHRQDNRVRYILHDKNKGEAAARNTGIKAATGKYVAFLDSDDEWLPGKLDNQVHALEMAPLTVGAVSARHLLVDDDGKETIVRDWTETRPITCLDLLARGCGLSMGNTFLVRASAFRDVGYFDENLRLFVDLDWLCSFTQKYNVTMLPNVVAKYYKAPMRGGDLVSNAVASFKLKNDPLLRRYGVIDRLRIASSFYNYISLAFAANGPWWKFVKTRFLHLALNPVQRLGNYVHFALVLVGLIRIGKRS